MTIRDVVTRSGRNLRAAKLRTLLTALALAVGGFTLTLTLAAAQGARDYTHRLISSNFDPASLIVAKDDSMFSLGGGSSGNKPREYDSSETSLGAQGNFRVKRLNTQDIDKIAHVSGVQDVRIDYQFIAQFVTRPGAKQYSASLGGYATAAKPDVVAGRLPTNLKAGEILLPKDYVSLLGFASDRDALGKAVTVQVQQLTGKTQAEQFKVVAVVTPPAANASLEAPRILFGTADATRLNQFINAGTTAANQYLTVYAKVKNGADTDQLQATKHRIEQAGYVAETAQEAQQLLNQIVNVLQIIILVFGAITLVASFFGVVNTQYISVLERTREIGLMKALGMRRSTVSWLFIIEATWIGLLGALIGSVGAFAAGTLLNPWISHKINFGSEHLLVFKPLQIGALILFLMVITTLAGLLPARKAAKLDPIEALRTE